METADKKNDGAYAPISSSAINHSFVKKKAYELYSVGVGSL
jgi:hypothetical protein